MSIACRPSCSGGSAAQLQQAVQATAGLRVLASAAPGSATLEPELKQFLDVVRVTVPGLRQRREDIPLLAERFMREISREYGREPKRLESGLPGRAPGA